MTAWKEENVLTGFIILSLVCHGMFFFREWLILGLALLGYKIVKWKEKKNAGSFHLMNWTRLKSQGLKNNLIKIIKLCLKPRTILIIMIMLSLLGLCNPVRKMAGWLEALRWLVFLLAYLWGQSLSSNFSIKEKLIDKIILFSGIITLIAMMPSSEMIWAPSGPPEQARFALSFGYANAAAAYLGCLLLLLQRNNDFNPAFFLLFFLGLVCSGSRAALLLFLLFSLVVICKREILNYRIYGGSHSLGLQGFRLEHGSEERDWITILMTLVLFWVLITRFEDSWRHLLNWEPASWRERLYYYMDSFLLAWNNKFLPEAGGWLAFPFIQTNPYWTLNPHSSLCSILVNQGLVGVILLLIWAIKGIIGYFKELARGDDMTAICCQTAVVYLGLHSLIDVDMSFGTLGIMFWLLAGMSSK